MAFAPARRAARRHLGTGAGLVALTILSGAVASACGLVAGLDATDRLGFSDGDAELLDSTTPMAIDSSVGRSDSAANADAADATKTIDGARDDDALAETDSIADSQRTNIESGVEDSGGIPVDSSASDSNGRSDQSADGGASDAAADSPTRSAIALVQQIGWTPGPITTSPARANDLFVLAVAYEPDAPIVDIEVDGAAPTAMLQPTLSCTGSDVGFLVLVFPVAAQASDIMVTMAGQAAMVLLEFSGASQITTAAALCNGSEGTSGGATSSPAVQALSGPPSLGIALYSTNSGQVASVSAFDSAWLPLNTGVAPLTPTGAWSTTAPAANYSVNWTLTGAGGGGGPASENATATVVLGFQ